MIYWLFLPGAVVALLGIQLLHFAWLMSWSNQQTDRLKYYGLPAAERQRFRQKLLKHATFSAPIRWLLSKASRFRFESGSFRYRGIAGPKSGSCSEASFQRAESYQPKSSDVFVVTQMRSGTTWMQHLIFQILTRGTRDLALEDVCLNAISPWIESHKSVKIDDAPKVGVDDTRRTIIKTHLPVALCPYNRQAKYIYVARHPFSCFASCVDFVNMNLRGFEPTLEQCVDWFLSTELMWWGTWRDHVAGWFERASVEDNVLLVRFEDMKKDLDGVVVQLAQFLDVPKLSGAELDAIRARCSFEYMQSHANIFEMLPPHVLQIPDRFFVRGRSFEDVSLGPSIQDRIRTWCLDANGREPLAALYPNIETSERNEPSQTPVEMSAGMGL